MLTKYARANADAVRLFTDGIGRGSSYDEIANRIFAACDGYFKKPSDILTPKNTPYFRVNPRDFRVPELAERILDLYSEDRGEGRQLYRFPVVLPFDQWLDNLPHGLHSYAASGLRYWSDYDATGERFCMTYAPVAASPAARRATRAWGGRTQILRAENNGRCEPMNCADYQCGACKLTASLLFYIPGIPGSSLIKMATSSVYSMQQIRSQMELVHRIRGGRISGVHDGRPIFYLTKMEDEVVHLDNGQPKRVRQHLVHLEANIDMTEVYARQEQQAITSGGRAAAALGLSTQRPDVPPAMDAVIEAQPEAVAAPATSPADAQPEEPLKQARRRVYALIRASGRPEAEVIAGIALKHGPEWGSQLQTLNAVETELIFGGGL